MVSSCLTGHRSCCRAALIAVLAVCTSIGLTGCHAIDFSGGTIQESEPLELEPPREKALTSLPAYRIGPPDIVRIEMLKQIPLPPYRVETHDLLQIQVLGTIPDQPIYDYFRVDGEGKVNLGPAYGKVRVAGMTIDEIRAVIERRLLEILTQPVVSVRLAQAMGTQPVTGEYLVGPDGTVNLRQYGSVHLAGKTVAEAKMDLQKHLSQFFDSPNASVSVLAYNSKKYYIITQGAALGDNVLRVPITGKEKVLDALSAVGGPSQLSSTNIWIARPAPGDFACKQVLPVDYDSITRDANAGTNYQIMPNDRVYIAEDPVVALGNFLAIATGPMERLFGVSSLGASTIRNLQTLGRNYNRLRR